MLLALDSVPDSCLIEGGDARPGGPIKRARARKQARRVVEANLIQGNFSFEIFEIF